MHMKLRQIHDLPNRTILAPEAMVYLSDQLADRQSKFTHSEKGPVEATRPRTRSTQNLRNWTWQSGPFQATCSEGRTFRKSCKYGSQIPQNRHEGHLWFPTAPILQMVPGETDWSSLGISTYGGRFHYYVVWRKFFSTIRGNRSAIVAIHTGFDKAETISNPVFLSTYESLFPA